MVKVSKTRNSVFVILFFIFVTKRRVTYIKNSKITKRGALDATVHEQGQQDVRTGEKKEMETKKKER